MHLGNAAHLRLQGLNCASLIVCSERLWLGSCTNNAINLIGSILVVFRKTLALLDL